MAVGVVGGRVDHAEVAAVRARIQIHVIAAPAAHETELVGGGGVLEVEARGLVRGVVAAAERAARRDQRERGGRRAHREEKPNARFSIGTPFSRRWACFSPKTAR